MNITTNKIIRMMNDVNTMKEFLKLHSLQLSLDANVRQQYESEIQQRVTTICEMLTDGYIYQKEFEDKNKVVFHGNADSFEGYPYGK